MDGPADTAELLRFLIRRMDDAIEAGTEPVSPPALLRLDGVDVACAVDGVDLHIKPFDGHPVDVLTGFTAPPEWFGIGVLTGGWGYQEGHRDERRRIRLTSFVCRDGTEVDAVRDGNELRFLDERAAGTVPDTLRRVLGLPTDPPDVTMDEFLAVTWLQMVLKDTKRGKRTPKLGWRAVASLHPAIKATGARPDHLPTVAPRMASAMSWERMRGVEAADDPTAAWMDDGMYARWQVHGRPPLTSLLRQVARRLTPEAHNKVEATLRDWGLLDTTSVA